MDETIIVCRCEDVTYDDVIKAIDQGFTSLEEIKRYLRCGMGPCQGRTCTQLIAGILSRRLGKPMTELKFPRARPPVRPIFLGVMGGGSEKKG